MALPSSSSLPLTPSIYSLGKFYWFHLRDIPMHFSPSQWLCSAGHFFLSSGPQRWPLGSLPVPFLTPFKPYHAARMFQQATEATVPVFRSQSCGRPQGKLGPHNDQRAPWSGSAPSPLSLPTPHSPPCPATLPATPELPSGFQPCHTPGPWTLFHSAISAFTQFL